MNSHKFLIINPFGIGDVLFTTPVIRAIKESYPDSIIGYWCNERVAPVLRNNPHIDMVFALSRGDLKKLYRQSLCRGICKSWGLFWRLRKGRFNTSLDFSLDHRYSLIAKFAGIKKRIGFNYKNRGRFLTDKIDTDGYRDKHVVEYYLDLLKILSIIPQSRNLELFVPETSKAKAESILNGHGIQDRDLLIGIAVGAGASWGQEASLKHWPAEKFARLADKIIVNFRAKIIIVGDDAERPIAEAVTKAMQERAINLTGVTTLEELSAIIEKLGVLITNDGGPLHMAAALGKKTVSFFGPVDPEVYGPYPPDEKRHIVLKKNLECSPCYTRFHLSGCRRNKECLETIDVDSALDAVAKLL